MDYGKPTLRYLTLDPNSGHWSTDVAVDCIEGLASRVEVQITEYVRHDPSTFVEEISKGHDPGIAEYKAAKHDKGFISQIEKTDTGFDWDIGKFKDYSKMIEDVSIKIAPPFTNSTALFRIFSYIEKAQGDPDDKLLALSAIKIAWGELNQFLPLAGTRVAAWPVTLDSVKEVFKTVAVNNLTAIRILAGRPPFRINATTLQDTALLAAAKIIAAIKSASARLMDHLSAAQVIREMWDKGEALFPEGLKNRPKIMSSILSQSGDTSLTIKEATDTLSTLPRSFNTTVNGFTEFKDLRCYGVVDQPAIQVVFVDFNIMFTELRQFELTRFVNLKLESIAAAISGSQGKIYLSSATSAEVALEYGNFLSSSYYSGVAHLLSTNYMVGDEARLSNPESGFIILPPGNGIFLSDERIDFASKERDIFVGLKVESFGSFQYPTEGVPTSGLFDPKICNMVSPDDFEKALSFKSTESKIEGFTIKKPLEQESWTKARTLTGIGAVKSQSMKMDDLMSYGFNVFYIAPPSLKLFKSQMQQIVRFMKPWSYQNFSQELLHHFLINAPMHLKARVSADGGVNTDSGRVAYVARMAVILNLFTSIYGFTLAPINLTDAAMFVKAKPSMRS